MFITQEQLNQVLDNYFTMTDAHIFNQQYFDHSLQLILDNHHDLYDLMRGSGYNIAQLAFEALRRFADEACKDEYGDIQGVTTYMLVRWAWTTDKTDTYSLAIMDNTINYITNERAEAQKEEEESMNINANLNTVNAELENDDLYVECAECGERILKEDAVEIDGEWYCESCVDEEFVTCCECGEYTRRDEATYADGEWFCEDCANNNLAYCEDCEEYHREENGQYVDSVDRWVCDDCLERHYTECEHCNEYVPDGDTITVVVSSRGYTEEWCQCCVEDYTWTCDNCCQTFSDDVNSHEDGYNTYCADCYEECSDEEECQDTGNIDTWRSPRTRQGYYFKPVPCLCATESEKSAAGYDWRDKIVFYGFELEIDRKEKCYKEDEWSGKIVDVLTSTYCKTDCSLDKGGSYSGIEIVSHPATLDWFQQRHGDFDEAFTMLKEGGWLSHDAGTCGLHVHISLHALEAANPYAVNNMLFIFDRFWDNFVKFSRRTESQLNQWARRYSTAHGEYKTIKNMAKRECDRYMAVNLQNAHTVELRMFRGTLNTETFFATLQLVDTLVKRCIEIGDDYRRLQSLSWAELVASEHAELNAYLERRGLKDGAVELPEPAEGDEQIVDLVPGLRIRVRDDCQYSYLRGRTGCIVHVDEDGDCAIRIDDNSGIEGILHYCGGYTEESRGYWLREADFDVVICA